ncbi:MAG: hypothetical protein KDA89_18240 [Planctomycetaceae bacterium]|nr:hypothetical protein [Planctomycetaceae bacterium]
MAFNGRLLVLTGVVLGLAGVQVQTSPIYAKGGRTRAPEGPVLVQGRDFADATAGMQVVVDGFESLTAGPQGDSTLQLTNGTYIGGTAAYIHYAESGPDLDLYNEIFNVSFSGNSLSDSIQEPRTFTNFPSGTTYWGIEIADLDSAEFDIVIVGNSGTRILEAVRHGDLNGFLGVHDPQGLISVSITTVDFSSSGGGGFGLSNYYMDNVVTAAP